MRIGELSKLSGVPVPTIKYYIREGLVDPGERTDFNQTRYELSHVERLKLIKLLTGYGRLTLAEVGKLFQRIHGSETKEETLGALGVGGNVDRDQALSEDDAQWANKMLDRFTVEDKYMQRTRGAGKNMRSILEQFPQEYRGQVEGFIDEYAEIAKKIAKLDLELGKTLIKDDTTYERHVIISIATVMLRSELVEAMVAIEHERALMDEFFSPEDFAELAEKYGDKAEV